VTKRPAGLDAHLGKFAVGFADALKTATPAEKAVLAASIRSRAPIALMDQAGAAADQVERGMKALAAQRPADAAPQPGGVPDWVMVSGLETLSRYALGLGSTCMHNPDPLKPRPVYACAWRPGVVACADCAPRLFRLVGEADKRCDQCGAISDRVNTALAPFGLLTFLFGLCAGCFGDLDAAGVAE
jgi:hypothetical protein